MGLIGARRLLCLDSSILGRVWCDGLCDGRGLVMVFVLRRSKDLVMDFVLRRFECSVMVLVLRRFEGSVMVLVLRHFEGSVMVLVLRCFKVGRRGVFFEVGRRVFILGRRCGPYRGRRR